ncbi:hypothetical protein [Pseudoglutamicibacter cumminsii]|uniref:hypothetical protein n=1 Tax=Pseudoglutamicibacter cumminsii TaxID=156979 RepID=UPI00195CD703|nr:hypothetical protein [Pseudoglutamicibacter cumminsii]MBM7796109.1 outer membrane murein-binding lipoprotein Lpp [Pseudoglutamicibacter cumminsii]
MSESSRHDEEATQSFPASPPPPGPEDEATQALPAAPAAPEATSDAAPAVPPAPLPLDAFHGAGLDGTDGHGTTFQDTHFQSEEFPNEDTTHGESIDDATFTNHTAFLTPAPSSDSGPFVDPEPSSEYHGLDSEMWYQDAPATFDAATYSAVNAPSGGPYLDDSTDSGRATSVAAGVTAAGLMSATHNAASPASSRRASSRRSASKRSSDGTGKNITIAAVLAAMLGLGGGVILGNTLLAPDPTRSAEYMKLSSEKSQVDSQAAKGEQKREELEQTIASYKDEEHGLNAQLKDQQKKQKELQDDQTKLKKDQEQLKKDRKKLKKDREKLEKDIEIVSRPGRSSGQWEIGEDIPEGKYRTKSSVSDRCVYAVYADSAYSKVKYSRVVDSGTPRLTLKEGEFFSSMGCGSWVRDT